MEAIKAPLTLELLPSPRLRYAALPASCRSSQRCTRVSTLEMRTKDCARREHDAVALRRFRQYERVLDMRESRPDEHAVRGLHERFQSDAFESAHDIEARLTKPLVQARQIFAVVAIHQHEIDEPLGELRGGDDGQHLDVGELVGDVLRAGDETHAQAACRHAATEPCEINCTRPVKPAKGLREPIHTGIFWDAYKKGEIEATGRAL